MKPERLIVNAALYPLLVAGTFVVCCDDFRAPANEIAARALYNRLQSLKRDISTRKSSEVMQKPEAPRQENFSSRSVSSARSLATTSGADRLIPDRADTPQERRIDDQFAEGVNQSHIRRRETANTPNVDAEIEAIGAGRLEQRG